MRPKSLILLLLALGCGLVAAIGINQVLANRPVQQAADTGEMVPIFVALTDIGMGDPLSPEVLKLEDWPKSKVPNGVLADLADVEGRRAPGEDTSPASPSSRPSCLPRGSKVRSSRT